VGLVEQIKADILQITSDPEGFGVPIALTAPTGQTINIIGLHAKHHLGVDTDGNRMNTMHARISFSESVLQGYPVRNAIGEVILINHFVSVKDSTGVDCKYIIRECYPDETVGLIVCILGDFV
jgi:hypothetical protein